MEVGSSSLPGTTHRRKAMCLQAQKAWDYTPMYNEHQCVPGSFFGNSFGGLAQLARALAWHARGHRFDPDILHYPRKEEEIFDILTHKTVSNERLCF